MNSTENLPLISVVIPNYNGAEYLEPCLRSLRAQELQKVEIVVVDNGSQDSSAEIVRTTMPEAILLRQDRNLGFAGGVNAGIRSSHGEWIAVVNNDTELDLNWATECVRAIQEHPDAAFFACKILDFNNRRRLYSAGDCYLRGGVGYRRGQELPDREDFNQECEIFSACGCAALYRRNVLDEVEGFDEGFFAYLEDVDLGLRIQSAGYRGYYLPRAVVYHIGSATSGGEFSQMAVRLRTRNALLLLLKDIPTGILLRCLPMILLMQSSWFVRVAARRCLASYFKGLGGALLLAPALIRKRTALRHVGRNSSRRLWQKIRQSEALAYEDFAPEREESVSKFLKLYFRLFK